MRFACLTLFCATASVVSADIRAEFREGAPKDRFSFVASDGCMSTPFDIIVDLSGSEAGLVFDTTDAGAGVEVFQPFELVEGAALVTAITPVGDGDQAVTLSLSSLPMGQPVAFTIDVDDTAGTRAITVNNAEITGAAVVMRKDGAESTAEFDGSATALIATCGL